MPSFDPDWYFGGLNYLKIRDFKPILEKGERPPYPMIIHNPTLGEVTHNWNKADTGIFIAFAISGTHSKNLKYRSFHDLFPNPFHCRESKCKKILLENELL